MHWAPSVTGRCDTFELVASSFTVSWQEKHSVVRLPSRSFFSRELWALWQLVQSFFAGGCWRDRLAIMSFISSWHESHSSFTGMTIFPGFFASLRSWQSEQSPSLKGACDQPLAASCGERGAGPCSFAGVAASAEHKTRSSTRDMYSPECKGQAHRGNPALRRQAAAA